MTAFGKTLDLLAFLNELPAIAQRADTERLSVLLPAFRDQFPVLWEDIVYCANMDSPALVLTYLCERDSRLVFLRKVPNIESIIEFLMKFIRERGNQHAEVNSFGDGNAVDAKQPTRRRATRRVHA
jgi:hypothetical protein